MLILFGAAAILIRGSQSSLLLSQPSNLLLEHVPFRKSCSNAAVDLQFNSKNSYENVLVSDASVGSGLLHESNNVSLFQSPVLIRKVYQWKRMIRKRLRHVP